jgi:hypothetical protein
MKVSLGPFLVREFPATVSRCDEETLTMDRADVYCKGKGKLIKQEYTYRGGAFAMVSLHGE